LPIKTHKGSCPGIHNRICNTPSFLSIWRIPGKWQRNSLLQERYFLMYRASYRQEFGLIWSQVGWIVIFWADLVIAHERWKHWDPANVSVYLGTLEFSIPFEKKQVNMSKY